jgi:hypothetical protein
VDDDLRTVGAVGGRGLVGERDVQQVDERVGPLLVGGARVVVRVGGDEGVDARREQRACLGVEHPGDAVHPRVRRADGEPAAVVPAFGVALERVRRDGGDPPARDDREPARVELPGGGGEERVPARDRLRGQRPDRRGRDAQVRSGDGALGERRRERGQPGEGTAERDERRGVALGRAEVGAEPGPRRGGAERARGVARVEEPDGGRLRRRDSARQQLERGEVRAERRVAERRRVDVEHVTHREPPPFERER